MKVTLAEILMSKQVNSVKPGNLRSDVMQSLGKPKDWSYGCSMLNAPTWKYNDMEITFEQDVVSLIALYFSESDTQSPTSEENTLSFETSNLASFTENLLAAGIQYEVDKILSFDSQVCLSVDKEVKVFFVEKGQKMHSVQIVMPS